MFRDILRVGGPAVLNNLAANLAVVVATSLIAPLGAAALAGFGLGIRLEYLQIPIVFGVGTGMVAMVGMNVGAHQHARARQIALTGACIAGVATEAVGLAAAIFPHAWLHLFTHDDAALDMGVRYLHVVAPAYGLYGIGLALYFASQGAKRMKWSVGASFARVALVGVLGTAAIHWGPCVCRAGQPRPDRRSCSRWWSPWPPSLRSTSCLGSRRWARLASKGQGLLPPGPHQRQSL